jgi:hypothetical protein
VTYRDPREAKIEKLELERDEARAALLKRPRKPSILTFVVGAYFAPTALVGVNIGMSYGLHALLALLMPTEVAWIMAVATSLVSNVAAFAAFLAITDES